MNKYTQKISENMQNQLREYVKTQTKRQGFVESEDLEGLETSVNPQNLDLNEGFTLDDLIKTFKLSMVTESLTDQYAVVHLEGAKKYNADWFHDYIAGFWVPDELGHMEPHKKVLINLGLYEEDLDRELKYAAEQTSYPPKHRGGILPVQLTTYGMIQECVTDYWYKLQANIFPIKSKARKAILKVKGREALHTFQFRNLTAFQLEDDPGLLEPFLETVCNFEMPGNHIPNVKEYEHKAVEWIPYMNGSVFEQLKRIIRNLYKTLEDPLQFGKLMLKYADSREMQIISFLPNSYVLKVANALKWSHGIVGEVILEQVGLSNLAPAYGGMYGKFRNPIKRWINAKFNLRNYFNMETNSPATN